LKRTGTSEQEEYRRIENSPIKIRDRRSLHGQERLDKRESAIRNDDGALINEGDGTQSDET
jgi:hypothetical protein